MKELRTFEDIKYIMERSCLNKRSYTQKSADDAVDQALRYDSKLFYYYKCQFCSSYHLTSKVPVTVQQLEVV